MPGPQFTDSFVRVKKKVKASGAILLIGLPGVGFASKLAVDYLVHQLEAERVATIYSPHFPNQVVATATGNLRPFTLKFYYKKLNGQKLFLLKGDLQPLTVEGQYEVAAKALEFFAASGGKRVFAMAGLVTQIPRSKKREVYASSTHQAELADLKKKLGVSVTSSFIPIVGMAGLIPALAPLYRLRGSSLLVETTGEAIDPVAASRLVDLVGLLVNKRIPVDALNKKAKQAKLNLEKMAQKQAGQLEQPALPGAAPAEPRDSLSYIR